MPYKYFKFEEIVLKIRPFPTFQRNFVLKNTRWLGPLARFGVF